MIDVLRNRPIPEITDGTKEFWEAAKNEILVMQKCKKCGTINFPPKPWCIECGSRDIEFCEMKKQGTIYSFTVAHSVMMNYPSWQSSLPIIMCIVDIEDGARMYGRLTGCELDAVEINMDVEVYFEHVNDEISIPVFRSPVVR